MRWRPLPFPDGTFDVCRAGRLLEHLPDAGRALTEMVRVTRPGGRIVVFVFDFDWDTLIIDQPDKETTRTIVIVGVKELIRSDRPISARRRRACGPRPGNRRL